MNDSKFIEKRISEIAEQNRSLDARIMELYSLYNISKTLSTTTQLEEIFESTMELINTSLKIDDYCIMLIDETDNKLKFHAVHSDTDLSDIEFELGEGVTGAVAATGVTRLVQDVSMEDDFLFYKGRKNNIGAFLCIPLSGKDGSVLGTLNVHKPEKGSIEKSDVELFTEIADQIAVAIDKALSFRKIKDLSVTDELTGLFNRRHFFEHFEREMKRAKRYKRNISIAMIDVDNFKNFNDTNGHQLGDNALKTVAEILLNSVRTPDIVARLGGEEFIIAFTETDKSSALIVSEKLRAIIEETKVEGEENQPGGKLTATFGVSSFPDDAEYATELIGCADRALYLGKSKGRNVVVPYSA